MRPHGTTTGESLMKRDSDQGGAAPPPPVQPRAALGAAALSLALAVGPATAARVGSAVSPRADLEAERASIEAWRTERPRSLTSDTGWLTLAGLFWLKEGENSFGRAASNALVLDRAALADTAGS